MVGHSPGPQDWLATIAGTKYVVNIETQEFNPPRSNRRPMDEAERIAAVEAVPEDSTFLFTVRAVESGEEKEAILVRNGGDDSIHGWLNYCQHYTHIHLDKGDGALMRDGEIICQNHGAWFEPDSGLCTFGPCEGAFLNDIEIAVEDGVVCLTDDEYEFLDVGPAEDEDLDLTSTSNLDF